MNNDQIYGHLVNSAVRGVIRELLSYAAIHGIVTQARSRAAALLC
jgi:hypothetical protein